MGFRFSRRINLFPGLTLNLSGWCPKLAVQGCKTCSSLGGHKKARRGEQHGDFQNAGQTASERRARHEMAVFFHETENRMAKLGMLAPDSPRTRDRKPKLSGRDDVGY